MLVCDQYPLFFKFPIFAIIMFSMRKYLISICLTCFLKIPRTKTTFIMIIIFKILEQNFTCTIFSFYMSQGRMPISIILKNNIKLYSVNILGFQR